MSVCLIPALTRAAPFPTRWRCLEAAGASCSSQRKAAPGPGRCWSGSSPTVPRRGRARRGTGTGTWWSSRCGPPRSRNRPVATAACSHSSWMFPRCWRCGCPAPFWTGCSAVRPIGLSAFDSELRHLRVNTALESRGASRAAERRRQPEGAAAGAGSAPPRRRRSYTGIESRQVLAELVRPQRSRTSRGHGRVSAGRNTGRQGGCPVGVRPPTTAPHHQCTAATRCRHSGSRSLLAGSRAAVPGCR